MNEHKYHQDLPVGIHRVFREPFDDKEVFLSMEDLLDYCKNGARYNGNKVSCIIGSGENGGYVQDFVINNDYPIIQFKNGELIVHQEMKQYVLVYYYNPLYSPAIMYNSNAPSLNYLNNPFQYSILELLDAFRSSTTSHFSFMICRTDIKTGTSKQTNWNQEYHPIREAEKISTTPTGMRYYADDSNAAILCTAANPNDDSVLESCNIIPKVKKDPYITEIYLHAPAYIKAAKGVVV